MIGVKSVSVFTSIRFLGRHSIRTVSVTNVRFLQSKTVIDRQIKDKYRAKLEAIARQKGIESPDELIEEMKDTIEERKKELNMIDPLKELEDYEAALAIKEAQQGKKMLDPISKDAPKGKFKTLEDYLILEKVRELGEKEIEFLWRAKFAKDERSVVGVAPTESYFKMYLNARKFPTFVLPLPREDAQVEGNKEDGKTPMELHFVQWSFVGPNTTHCMITTLMEYKLHGEYARPHTTVSFHQELSAEKGLVLMNGHVDENAALTMSDAQLLLLNVQRFYGAFGTGSDVEKARLELVRQFNAGETDFDIEAVVKLSQTMEH